MHSKDKLRFEHARKSNVGLTFTVLKALSSLHGINVNAQFIPKDTPLETTRAQDMK